MNILFFVGFWVKFAGYPVRPCAIGLPSSTTSWSPFPQGKADGYRNLKVGLTRFCFY